MTSQNDPKGAHFEIRVDGIVRSHRDARDADDRGGAVSPGRTPGAKIAVTDLRDGSNVQWAGDVTLRWRRTIDESPHMFSTPSRSGNRRSKRSWGWACDLPDYLNVSGLVVFPPAGRNPRPDHQP